MTSPSKASFITIGHRGACGHEPENTLRSFSKALEIGVKWIELDVRVVENTPIVFHDRSLRRCTGVEGLIEEKTLDYVRSLDAGKGEHIPLLEEVLDLLGGKAGIIIELKGAGCVGPVSSLLSRRLGAWWSKETIICSSFDHRQLIEFRTRHPELPLAPIVKGCPLELTRTTQLLNAYSTHLDLEFTNAERIEELHADGRRVYVFTVNTPDDLAFVRTCGADGVFSDFPDKILAAL